MKLLFATFILACMMKNAQAQPPMEMLLYPGAVPNSKPTTIKEGATFKDNVTRIEKVSVPTITAFHPKKPNGTAVIICPGGGYGILAFDKEGTRVAEVLNEWGVTAFVLKYRLPNDSMNMDKSLAPLQDAQRAIQWVRSQAAKFHIQPNKIGIMGFSAGGHLAATVLTHFQIKADGTSTDTTSRRPDFGILIYPVISMDSSITHKGSRTNLIGKNPEESQVDFFSNELQVTKKTPPVFLIHAGDDTAVPVANSLRFYQACIQHKVPAEMHLYPKGGHGFGMYNTTTQDVWMERLNNWIANIAK